MKVIVNASVAEVMGHFAAFLAQPAQPGSANKQMEALAGTSHSVVTRTGRNTLEVKTTWDGPKWQGAISVAKVTVAKHRRGSTVELVPSVTGVPQLTQADIEATGMTVAQFVALEPRAEAEFGANLNAFIAAQRQVPGVE
jgi:hypothetical protein